MFSRNIGKVNKKKGKVYSAANCSLNLLHGKNNGQDFKICIWQEAGCPIENSENVSFSVKLQVAQAMLKSTIDCAVGCGLHYTACFGVKGVSASECWDICTCCWLSFVIVTLICCVGASRWSNIHFLPFSCNFASLGSKTLPFEGNY